LIDEIEHAAAMATTALQCKPDGDTTSENGRRAAGGCTALPILQQMVFPPQLPMH
jgi:hypothetical protein